ARAWRQLMAGAISDGQPGLPGVGPVLMGGFSFDAVRPESRLWQNYPPGHLVLPQLTFTQTHGQTWLTYNTLVSAASHPDVEAAELDSLSRRWFEAAEVILAGEYDEPLPGLAGHAHVSQEELRPAADWQADVANAVAAIRRGELEKVVLARAVQL